VFPPGRWCSSLDRRRRQRDGRLRTDAEGKQGTEAGQVLDRLDALGAGPLTSSASSTACPATARDHGAAHVRPPTTSGPSRRRRRRELGDEPAPRVHRWQAALVAVILDPGPSGAEDGAGRRRHRSAAGDRGDAIGRRRHPGRAGRR
jgi:hypothetical protein